MLATRTRPRTRCGGERGGGQRDTAAVGVPDEHGLLDAGSVEGGQHNLGVAEESRRAVGA